MTQADLITEFINGSARELKAGKLKLNGDVLTYDGKEVARREDRTYYFSRGRHSRIKWLTDWAARQLALIEINEHDCVYVKQKTSEEYEYKGYRVILWRGKTKREDRVQIQDEHNMLHTSHALVASFHDKEKCWEKWDKAVQSQLRYKVRCEMYRKIQNSGIPQILYSMAITDYKEFQLRHKDYYRVLIYRNTELPLYTMGTEKQLLLLKEFIKKYGKRVKALYALQTG